MFKSYKYRLKPDRTKAEMIDKHISAVRWIYNWGLSKKISLYEQESKNLSCFDLCKDIAKLKKLPDYFWLKDVNSQSLQYAMSNLDCAFTQFFKYKKGFPNFKSKHKSRWSYGNPQRVKVDFNEGFITLPKIGIVKAVFDREFDGLIKTCTVSKTRTNKYYISILVDNKKSVLKNSIVTSNTTVGLDMGLKDFVTISTGDKIAHPKWIRQSEARVKVLQRRMSRKVNGSKNREKAKLTIALNHEKITNQRKDFIHKLSTKIANDKGINSVAIENLNIKGMMRNHNLARSIGDTSWNMFEQLLKYKLENQGKSLIYIGRFEPSSRTCSCGRINHNLKLSDRVWTCEFCGSTHDRDILAAQNIKKFALQKQNLISPQGLGVELRESCTIVQALN